MANRRMIYGDMFDDDEIGTLPIQVRLMWVGLIVALADDQGRILDNAALINSKVFVYDSGITEKQINEWLQMLQECGAIYRYRVGRKKLIQIIKWWDYQTPSWANASKFPAPENWIDRIKIHTKGNKVKTVDWDKDGGFHDDIPTNVPTEIPTDIPTDIPADDHIRDVNVNVNGDVNGDVNGESEIKDARSDFSAFQQVWEQETGHMVSGYTEFTRMCERFEKEGVTPDLYRTAIQEQQQSEYPVKRPTSVEEWAVRLANPKSVKANIPKRKQIYIGPNGEEIEREI